jgi:hypothetical protein
MDDRSRLLIAEDALQRVARMGCEGVQTVAREALRRIGTVGEMNSCVDGSGRALDGSGGVLGVGDTQGSTRSRNGSNAV